MSQLSDDRLLFWVSVIALASVALLTLLVVKCG